MAKCTVCGAKTSFMMSMCDSCIESGRQRDLDAIDRANVERGVQSQPLGITPTGSTSAGSEGACLLVGGLLLAVGFFFLVVNPSEGGAELLGHQVVNLQRIYLGQTSAICGAVFLAAGMRPR
jgi:hypothetical protein